MQSKPRKRQSKNSPYVFLWVFVAMGIVTLTLGIRDLMTKPSSDTKVLLVVGGMFSFIPLVIMNLLRSQQQREENRFQVKSIDPAPWLARDEWAKGVIAGKENRMAHLYFFAAGAAAIFIGLFGGVFMRGSGNLYLNLIVLFIFALPAAVMTTRGWRALSRQKKFGQSFFHMSSIPGVVGGHLDGHIEIGTRFKPVEGFKLRLRCCNVTASGKNSKTRELWWSEKKVPAGQIPLPVNFDIPAECEESDYADRANQIVWQLEARAAVSGVDYFARFEVPVFKPRPSAGKP